MCTIIIACAQLSSCWASNIKEKYTTPSWDLTPLSARQQLFLFAFHTKQLLFGLHTKISWCILQKVLFCCVSARFNQLWLPVITTRKRFQRKSCFSHKTRFSKSKYTTKVHTVKNKSYSFNLEFNNGNLLTSITMTKEFKTVKNTFQGKVNLSGCFSWLLSSACQLSSPRPVASIHPSQPPPCTTRRLHWQTC